MKKCVILTVLIPLFWSNPPSWGNGTEFVGIVKNVQADAYIIRNDVSEIAVVGQKVFMGDVLKTGSKGSMGVIFKDDTIISMGPGTEVFVKNFCFEPLEGNLLFIVKMLKGTVSFISGQISKLSPNAVHFETPVATIGPRGTHFLVNAEEE